ncbi:MAG: glycosyltransferase [Novosphingobium sp.]
MSFQMVETKKGPLVLLFYDGYEWRARDGFLPGWQAQARRLARYAWRTLRRKQVYTGFYTAFLALRTALERHGCDVRVNDFKTARAMPDYPIGIAGYDTVLDAVKLGNPAIFGPGDFGDPEPARQVAARPDIKLMIQPSEWFCEFYRPTCGNKMVVWPAGIDMDRWADRSGDEKSVDVLIYDKLRWHRATRVPEVLDRLTRHLDARGLTWKVLRYGHHHLAQFESALGESRSMAFLCEHETQGLACEEAMASGVPVFAWDEGVLVDPRQVKHARPDLAVSSVPYFDDRCGRQFKLAAMEGEFDAFWAALPGYAPRAYVAETLSFEQSAKAYLELYQAAGSAA